LDKGETKTLMQSLHFARLETAHAREDYTVGRCAGKPYMATPRGTQGTAQAQTDCQREGSNPVSRLMPYNNTGSGKQKMARKAVKQLAPKN
jgi:hypothetical protein